MATRTPIPKSKQTSKGAAAKASPPTPAPAPKLNEKQARKRLSKAQQSTLSMRKLLWPDIKGDSLWLRKDRTGFTTIPRAMPLFMEIIADASKQVSPKSVPAGKALLVLWCRVFDEGLVRIDVEATAAGEAGYVGERAVSTWREHLRVLKELGFIDVAGGAAGPNQWVLLLNPYQAVKKLYEEGKVQKGAYFTLFQRAQEIGATDMEDEEDDD
jgi:hypothetical protein